MLLLLISYVVEGVVKRERFMLIFTTLLNILVDNLFDNFIKGIYTLLFA